MLTLERTGNRRRTRARALSGRTVVVTGATAGDQDALKRFFDGLTEPVTRVVVADDEHIERLALAVARIGVEKITPGGTLALVGDAVRPAFTAGLEAALAPVGVSVDVVAPAAVPDLVFAKDTP